jgi:hypothetical protein
VQPAAKLQVTPSGAAAAALTDPANAASAAAASSSISSAETAGERIEPTGADENMS